MMRVTTRVLERRLTICIAASANYGEHLVCAADTMIASGVATTDPIASKIHVVAEWTIMLSGTLGEADSFVDALTKGMLLSSDNDPHTVRALLEKTHREQLASWSAGRWLAPYGMDMPTFLSKTSVLPASVEAEVARNISSNVDEYDVELIVCGWGQTIKNLSQQGKSRPIPYIFSVDYRGIQLHKTTGLYACGSGSAAALSTLYYHNCGMQRTLEEVIYYVATAKFMAEKTLGVGPNTIMFVMSRNGGIASVHPGEIESIRQLWARDGAPHFPSTAKRIIGEFMRGKEYRDI